jgi:hypothetical protein
MSKYFPKEQLGIWCNNPLTPDKARKMRGTFDPRVSNLNVHLDQEAHDLFKRYWPESMPFGLTQDSRHSPVLVAMKDVIDDEGKRWELISSCDINRNWSAMIGVFRGELRAWFCEIAGAQSILHQDELDYPDTGIPLTGDGSERTDELNVCLGKKWWEMPMQFFSHQVRKHCHECGVPLRGRGQLAQAEDDSTGVCEQVSATHQSVLKPKRKGRRVELVTTVAQLGTPLKDPTRYLQNARD